MSHVLAVGGGAFRLSERYVRTPGPLVEHALSLTGVEAPRITGLFTATGDDRADVAGQRHLPDRHEVRRQGRAARRARR